MTPRISLRTGRALLAGLAVAFAAVATARAATLTVKTINGGQALADAVVYATLLTGTAPPRPKRELTIEQVNKTFVPLISVAQTGTLVNFPNRDPIWHHVYSFSPAKTFEIKLYSGVTAKPVLFDKPGEVVLGCNIHDTMVAYVLVVDTPYFAKSDAQGKAVLDNLPAGDYELRGWYPASSGNEARQRVRLGAGESATLTVDLPVKILAGTRLDAAK